MLKKVILFFGMFIFISATFASGNAPQLSGVEVKALFTDKTQYCDQIGKDKTCKTYNGPDGKVVRVMDADGVRREGKWWVSDKGEYCLRWNIKKKDLCFAVFKQEDGSYDLFKKGKHKATIIKLLDGNSEKF